LENIVKKLLVAPAVILLAFAGCMKVREELVVMPDGSGKIVLRFAIKTKGEAAKFTEAELMSGDPDEIEDKARGLAALTRATMEEKDGVVQLQMTGYFDDINALKFMDEGEGEKAKPKQEFSFRKEGEAFVLEIKGNLLSDDAPERGAKDPDLVRQRDEFFKSMFAGFEFQQDVRLPGRVTAVEGFQTRADRTATYLVGEKDLQKASDQKKINEVVRFKVSCARNEITDAEAAGFRKELEKAKADWVELRKEMKKNAGKRK
jgi:hypothetical protein